MGDISISFPLSGSHKAISHIASDEMWCVVSNLLSVCHHPNTGDDKYVIKNDKCKAWSETVGVKTSPREGVLENTTGHGVAVATGREGSEEQDGGWSLIPRPLWKPEKS